MTKGLLAQYYAENQGNVKGWYPRTLPSTASNISIYRPVFRAFIADLVGAKHRTTAYGIFEALIGLALFPASLLFGFLWDRCSVKTAFSVGAGLSMVAAVVFLLTQLVGRNTEPQQ